MKALLKRNFFFGLFIFYFAAFGQPMDGWSAPKGKIVIALGGELSNLDPQKSSSNYQWACYRFTYDYLVRREYKEGRIQHSPMLATSWEAINDTTWIFYLRKGVKFDNGEDFNAESVKYTIERQLDPKTKATWRSNLAFIDKVEILDPYTVKVITKEPAPLLITNIAFGLAMLPPKYFKEKGDSYVALHPCGTGPFKFVRWVKDQELVLEANDNYWAGPPKIKTLVIKPIPEDSTRVAALLSGDVDIAKDIPVHLIPMVNNSGRAKVSTVPAALGISIMFDTLTKGPLQDKRVRQAINYAVDKQKIIDTIMEGHGTVLASCLSPSIVGFDPNLKPYPYDAQKAKTLLKEAGFEGGLTLRYSTPSGRYVKDKEFAEAIAGQLAKVGITVNLQVLEWGMYMSGWNAGTLGEMFVIGQAHNFDADPIFRKILHSSNHPQSRWSNKQFDEIVAEAERTLDTQKRIMLYKKANRIVHEDCPALFFMAGVDTYGISNRVQNYTPTPDEGGDAIYVYGAWLRD